MESGSDSSLSSFTRNTAPNYSESPFIFPDFPASVDFQLEHSLANLRPSPPYPESPLNGLDPIDVAFSPSSTRGHTGQQIQMDPIRRPSSSHSYFGTPYTIHHPYAREPPGLNGPFSPPERVLQADERSTSTSTSYTSEIINQPTNTTPTRSGRPVLGAKSQRPSVFRCKWAGCRSSRQFRREGDLVRHLRTIHISPAAFVCPYTECEKSFGRRDHLSEHVRRRHGG
ncbi:hypothetical protein BJY00DRAFT_154381 [Aspergillus carlsbadensis]|nr:hypothetical protein BJY00DRAFT_154381 [Aspergillus carlsbadensis]